MPGGLLLPLSVRFPLSRSRSLSLCFLDFFFTFLLALLDEGGLLMTVEVTVREVQEEGGRGGGGRGGGGGGLGEAAGLGTGVR